MKKETGWFRNKWTSGQEESQQEEIEENFYDKVEILQLVGTYIFDVASR
jgi:hypothetical protein